MDNVARMTAFDRAALFNQTGAARGLSSVIIEKDFWVCWISSTSSDCKSRTRLASFSRVGNVTLEGIWRDTTVLRRHRPVVRSEGSRLRRRPRSSDGNFEEQGQSLDQESRGRCTTLHRELSASAPHRCNRQRAWSCGEGVELAIDDVEAQNLIFYYPASLGGTDYAGSAYLSRRVKLEFEHGDPWPIERREIQPFAAEEFPDFFIANLRCQRTGITAYILGKSNLAACPVPTCRLTSRRRNTYPGTTTTCPYWPLEKTAKPRCAISIFWRRWPIINRCSFARNGHTMKPRVLARFD